MSKFFETFGPPRIPVTGSSAESASAEPGRRRSSRWKAFIPVFVYGYGSGQEPFHEEAYSAVVSETGGLLVMRACMQPGHLLLITNRATGEERECRVAYVGAREPDQWAVAVEFKDPATAFWRLTTRIEPRLSTGENRLAEGSER